MDPLENQEQELEYSQESQEQINQNETLFEALQQQQREEAEASAQAAAAQAPPVEPEPTQSDAFQNPVEGIPGAAQQAADSTQEGMGQMFDAVGGFLDSALGGISEERSEERDEQRVAGKGGDERNVVGALQDLVQKGVDLLPEEWTEDRGLDVGPKLEDASESDRVMVGSVLGAAESTAEFAEVVGDFSKTLASKVNIVGYDPTDDPFSTDYNWASWNLGKDELGAQTPAGQIIQGFGEFAVTFAATGGGAATANLFRGGVSGIGAVARTAGREALEGVLADVVMSASGEGNLSNLIKAKAPDWYPTYLTALAIDEDDNPFEAAFKTALEGGMLGAPIGAVTAWFKGSRAVRKFKEANPKATQAELQQVAFDAIQGELNLGPAGKPAKPLAAADVASEMLDGNFSRADQVSPEVLRELVGNYQISDFVSEENLLGNFPFNTTMEALGKGVVNTKMPNGSNVEWIFSEAAGPTEGLDSVRIDWNISDADAKTGGLGEGGAGLKMFSRVKDAIKQADLAPGTIIQVEAADDGFGVVGSSKAQTRAFKKARKDWQDSNFEAGRDIYDQENGAGAFDALDEADQRLALNTLGFDKKLKDIPGKDDTTGVRSKLYQRAGLSPEDGEGAMWGIVKADKRGRKVFEPLDVNGDVDAQIFAARATGETQLSLDLGKTDAKALENLEGMKQAGIPPTWDDTAAVTPAMFVPGNRQIEAPAFNDEAMRVLLDLDPTNPNASAIANPFTGEVPVAGTAVSIDGATLNDVFNEEAIGNFIAKHYDVLTREDAFLVSRISNGNPVIDISRVVRDPNDAINLGKLYDQEGIYRLDTGEWIKTGGYDQLKGTQGANLKSISSRRVESKPVEPQKAATQRVNADQQLSPNAGSQNMLTDNQVRRLGTAGPERSAEILAEINDGSKIDLSELAAEAKMSEAEIVQQAAEMLGNDFGFNVADVSKLDLNPEGYLSRTGIVQARMVMQEMSSRLARTVYKANDASAKGMSNLEHTQDMVDTLKAFMKAYKVAANLNSKRLSAGAINLPPEFGLQKETLQNLYAGDEVAGMTKALDESEKMLDKMVEGLKGNNPKARKKALTIAAQLEMAGGDVYKLAQSSMTLNSVGTKLALKIMYNSMLSSPSTHIVNSVSNAVAVGLRPLAAAAGGDLRSRKAAAASFYSLGETLSDAMEMAGRKWNTNAEQVKGTDVSAGEASLALDELEARAEISNDDAFRTGVSVLRMMEGIANFPLFDWPSKALTTADEFFKTMVQRMEYKRMIMEEAIDLNGTDLDATWKHLYEKEKSLNFTKSGESLNKELNRIAKEVTFQQDLEGPAKAFGAWVDSYPALKIFFPFVRTGHNVAKYTASYVPVLAQAMEKLDAKYDYAKLPPYEQAIIKGRQKLGTAFLAASGLMAANGMLVGNGPMDPEARKRWLEQNQPRSIKIGDTFISLDRLEPFGPILSAVADIHYAVSEGQMKQERGEWMFGYLVQAMGVNMTDRTFFQGFQDVARLISPRNTHGNAIVGMAADTANNLIPAAGLRRMLTNALNPYMQEFNEQWDRTFYNASLGGLGDSATRYDFITGEPVSNMSGGINSILPFKINNIKQDVVKEALMSIEYNSDEIVEELGRTGIELTPDQISRLQQAMGNSDLHDRLKEIVTAPDWIASVEEYKEKVAKGHRVSKNSQMFYREVHDLISVYADDALDALVYENPEMGEALHQYQQDAAADRYGGLTEFYQQ